MKLQGPMLIKERHLLRGGGTTTWSVPTHLNIAECPVLDYPHYSFR